MAKVDENAAFWAEYDWANAGEEWSDGWGGSQAQWHGVILPRIARFLPAGSMLEIAPGHGRWTRYLREHCESLTIVIATRLASTPAGSGSRATAASRVR